MKKPIDKLTCLFSHPVFVIGSYDKDEKPNIMTVSWGGICCSTPPCINISIRKIRATYDNILLNKAFTVNIPTDKQVEAADYAGVFSGKNIDKFSKLGLTPVKSKLVNAPYIAEFPMVLECKLVNTIDVGVHIMFIGEIVESLVDEEFLNENQLPDISKIQPFIYDSASRSYFGIGEKLQDAYSAK